MIIILIGFIGLEINPLSQNLYSKKKKREIHEKNAEAREDLMWHIQ